MRKFIRKLRVIKIDVFVYIMTEYRPFNLPNGEYRIEKTKFKRKLRYSIQDSNKMIHQSFVFDKVFLLGLLNKHGPVIGDCVTNKKFRGLSIYPYVINYIAKELIETNNKEVYVIVNQDNLSSIKGIEKAGYTKYASIKATRWLWFYLKKHIRYCDNT